MSSDPVVTDYEHDAQEFERLCTRILRGRHHPSFSELLQGAPLFKDDIKLDADAFARSFLSILHHGNDPDGHLALVMARLTASHERDDFRAAALAFISFTQKPDVLLASPEEAIGRCWFYAALSGDREAIRLVASAARDTRVQTDRIEPALRQLKGTLAWALAAADLVGLPNPWTRESAERFLRQGDMLGEVLGELVERAIERRAAERTSGPVDVEAPPADEQAPSNVAAEAEKASGVIVFTSIGNPDTSEGKRVGSALRPLLGKRLRLVPVPNTQLAHSQLEDEFPHAVTVITAVLEPLVGRDAVEISPTILVGPPGCGKTTFSMRLADVLGLPLELFPCGGVSDSALAGTPRRWSSGEPSLPVQVIQSTECANPLIILDEIEKASTSRHNGALLDCLLSLWEPRTAQAWRDAYVEAPVDLSHVNWLGTANDLEGVPRAIRDRCRIVRFPAPSPEHLRQIAFYLMRNLSVGDHRWVRPLDESEAVALEQAWTDGSIRSLARLLMSVLKTREKFDARH